MPGMNGTRLKRRIAECSVADHSAPGARTLVRSTPRTSMPPHVPSASQPPGNNMLDMNGKRLRRVVFGGVLWRSGAQANATASWSACGKRSATPLSAGRTEWQGRITVDTPAKAGPNLPATNGTRLDPCFVRAAARFSAPKVRPIAAQGMPSLGEATLGFRKQIGKQTRHTQH